MTPQQFADILRELARDPAVDTMLAVLNEPPRRRPAEDLVSLIRWYQGLSEGDREHLKQALALVAHYAVLGVAVVLDGACAVDETKGRFTLKFTTPTGEESELAGPDVGPLHELL